MKKQILLLAILFAVTISPIFSQVKIVSVTSGNWFDPDTWSPAQVPTSEDTVIIQSGHTVEMKNIRYWGIFYYVDRSIVTVAKLKVQDGGKLSIYEGQFGSYARRTSHLTVTDTVVVDGTIEGDLSTTSSAYIVAFILHHQGSVLKGTGLMKYGMYSVENQRIDVLPGSDLNFNMLLTYISTGDSLVNYGSITTDQRIIGEAASSTFINEDSAFLSVGDSLLNVGTLSADAPGNTIQYTVLISNIPLKIPYNGKYYNLAVAALDTLYMTDNVTILNDFNFQSGSFQPNYDTITIYGDWYQYGDFIDDSSWVIFAGTQPQHITASSVANFYNLELGNTSSIVLGSDIQTKDTLVLNSLVKAGDYTFTLGESTSNIGYLDYKSGKIIGKFARWVVSSADPYFYPIGTSKYNTFVDIKFPVLSSGGVVSFNFEPVFPGTAGFPLTDYNGEKYYNPFSDGYWVADTSEKFSLGTGNTYDITLRGGGFTSFDITDSTSIAIRPHPDSTWRLQGLIGTNTVADSLVQRTSLDSFPRQFALVDTTNCSLPLLTGITGPTEVCRGDTGVLYISNPTSDDYTFYWTIDGGTINKSYGDSVTINWADSGQVATIYLYAQNQCSYGNTVSLTVDVNSIPPSELYGLKAVPEYSDSIMYYIDPRTNYTYTWFTSPNATIVDTAKSTDTAYVSFTVPGTDTIYVIAQDNNGCPSDTAAFPIIVYDVINSVQSGYWYDPSTWDCNCVPQINDNVRINNSHTVTVESYYDGKITVTNFDVNHLYISNGGVLNRTDAILSVNGDLIVDGLLDFSNYYLPLYNSQLTIGGTGQISVDSMLVPGSRTIAAGADLTVNGDFVLNDSYVLNNGKLTVNGDIEGTTSSTFENGYNSLVAVTDSLLIGSGSFISDTTGNTVIFAGADQIVTPQATSSNGYYNIIFSGSGTKTMNANLTVLNNLKILDDAALNTNNYDITIYGNWYDLSNASTPFVAGTSLVTFDAADTQYIYTLNPETFYDLKVGQNSVLALEPNQAVTVTDNFYLDGILWLKFYSKHDTLPSFIYDNDIVYGTNGKVQTDLYIDAKKWHEVSPAILGVTSDKFTLAHGNFNSNLYWYDESVDLDGNPSTEPAGTYNPSLLGYGWKFVQTSASQSVPLQLNRGYFFYDDRSYVLSMSGQVASVTATFDTTLSFHANDPDDDGDTLPNLYDGWNVLGNPYTAYLSIDSIINNSSLVDSGIYVWDDDSSEYAGYQKGFRVLSGRLGPYIPPLQGFAIRANDTGAIAVIRPQYRVHGKQMYLKKKALNPHKRYAIKLGFEANGKQEFFALYFYPGASEEFNGGYDMIHITPSYDKFPEIPRIYSLKGDVPLALEALPPKDIGNAVVPINVKTGLDGRYKLNVQYINGLTDDNAILLKDLKTGKFAILNLTKSYSFDYNTSDDPHRFDLYIVKDHAPVALPIKEQTAYEDSDFVLPLGQYISDPDFFDSLKLVLVNAPKWLSLNGDTLVGKPTQEDVGTYQIKVIAYDILNKSVSAQININVLNTNDPPKVTSAIANQQVVAGEKLIVTLPQNLFTDPDPGDKLTITAENLPQWLKFDPSSMILQGVPSNDDIGTYTITVKATDSYKASASTSFSVTVLQNPLLKNGDYTVYPNPTHDVVNILIAKNINKMKVKVIAPDGKIYIEKQISGNQGQIDLKDLPQGYYILQISTSSNTYTLKISKI